MHILRSRYCSFLHMTRTYEEYVRIRKYVTRMREHADLTNTILAQTRVGESSIAALAKNCTANFWGVRLIQFTTR